MSVPNAGIAAAATSAEAEDPKREYSVPSNPEEEDGPIAPDQFDPKYETTKWERWSYYCYYVGDNGLPLFNFAPYTIRLSDDVLVACENCTRCILRVLYLLSHSKSV
ncbi:hypothetical protein PV10_00228 [Exophiala mesophila]|uniref:Uncharacterized protein n=1 Tax=Exophiala mesophila TaxID=212818 RepID=A0A0D1ZNY3_EXOME|nr:uncharacterized protein PV10_00228 [Exophiala mesophila]KIV96347.1 hypothetical protein PV10_00228 [Exophiala mesophila]